jgi:hypothetical protein
MSILLDLAEIARRMGLTGKDCARSARRRILTSGCTYRKDGRAIKMTETDWTDYLERIKCSPSISANKSRSPAARTVSGRGAGPLKARALIAAMRLLRKKRKSTPDQGT